MKMTLVLVLDRLLLPYSHAWRSRRKFPTIRWRWRPGRARAAGPDRDGRGPQTRASDPRLSSREKTAAPVVLFSHGLGGSREGSAFLGKHWSARGYVCVFLQHPGSDTSVWKGKPAGGIAGRDAKAASLENFLLRVKDVPAVLDQLERWNKQSGHALRAGWT